MFEKINPLLDKNAATIRKRKFLNVVETTENKRIFANLSRVNEIFLF